MRPSPFFSITPIGPSADLGDKSASKTGVCYGRCGNFVKGSKCDLTGSEMIEGYIQVRGNGCGLRIKDF